MASASRMQMLLAQHSGVTQQDAKVQDLQKEQESIEGAIAETLQSLRTLEQETAEEEKTAMAMFAERVELDAALQARVAENKTTSQEVLDLQTKLAAIKNETAAEKQVFIVKCRGLDGEIRQLKQMHPGSSFVVGSSHLNRLK